MSTPAQRAHSLTTFFVKKYTERYGYAPGANGTAPVNRHTARWGWESILTGMSDADVRELIEYYLTINRPGHPLDWFFYNYDKLLVAKRESEEDSEHRKRLREQTKKRAEEWRKRVGNQGIAGNQRGPKE